MDYGMDMELVFNPSGPTSPDIIARMGQNRNNHNT